MSAALVADLSPVVVSEVEPRQPRPTGPITTPQRASLDRCRQFARERALAVYTLDERHWCVPSHSRPGFAHIVVADAGRLLCTCPARARAFTCSHAQAVWLALNALPAAKPAASQEAAPAGAGGQEDGPACLGCGTHARVDGDLLLCPDCYARDRGLACHLCGNPAQYEHPEGYLCDACAADLNRRIDAHNQQSAHDRKRDAKRAAAGRAATARRAAAAESPAEPPAKPARRAAARKPAPESAPPRHDDRAFSMFK